MATIAQTINERHLQGHGSKHHEERGSGIDILEDVGLFLATPLIGLSFVIFYGIVGLALIACYGLKAFGVQCGLFTK